MVLDFCVIIYYVTTIFYKGYLHIVNFVNFVNFVAYPLIKIIFNLMNLKIIKDEKKGYKFHHLKINNKYYHDRIT